MAISSKYLIEQIKSNNGSSDRISMWRYILKTLFSGVPV